MLAAPKKCKMAIETQNDLWMENIMKYYSAKVIQRFGLSPENEGKGNFGALGLKPMMISLEIIWGSTEWGNGDWSESIPVIGGTNGGRAATGEKPPCGVDAVALWPVDLGVDDDHRRARSTWGMCLL